KILIEDSRLVYNDRSIPILIYAEGFNYTGNGDLSKDIFDLYTHLEINSLDLYYANIPYILSKKINADLVTKINTSSLAFIFEKNDLKINQLPVHFTGQFAFLTNGYDMDFKLYSNKTALHDIITALPPEYLKWLDKTDVKGTGTINFSLAGKYIASTSTMPNLSFNMQIRDGYIANDKAPSPVHNLFMNFETTLPSLNPDSLQVDVDSLSFNVDKDDYFNSVIKIHGVNKPHIYAKINTEVDLAKWHKAFGIQPFNAKGRFTFHLLADGKYATGVVPKGLRKTDTVITCFPKFNLRSSLKDGYFKYASLPEAVNNINFDLQAGCPDSNYKHTSLKLENLNATVLNNFVKGYLRIGNAADFPMDADIKTVFHLDDIKKFYPLDGTTLSGDLNANVKIKGKYIPAKKTYPVIAANLNLENAAIKTKYYPHPIENIKVNATISNVDGSVKDMKVTLKPLSFVFEGQPFTINADLQNFADLKYNITSQGTIDVGKVYQVFSRKGYDVTGLIQTNLSLRGRQSDAVAGRYNKLYNSGSLQFKNVALTSELFPKPLIIKTGVFSFNQNKMRFDVFKAKYGQSSIVLNGALSNVINYIMNDKAMLSGNFDLKSDLIVIDEFTAFSESKNTPPKTSKKTTSTASTGVVIVPQNLDLTFTAAAKDIKYQGLDLKDFKGKMAISKGCINLSETGFTLIDAPITMDAKYGSITPKKAYFDYHITAKDFDVKRAYKEVKLFRDLASSASKAAGVISLDYQLSGKLDENMYPVYPSLKGGGTLSIKKVKVAGLKLFNAISSKTNKSEIKDPDLSKVDIKTTIANNIITIERTKMRIAGFRPRFEGKVSFNGDMNLKFRLGLPPLGIIGIPLSVTGNEENPKIKVSKGESTEEPAEKDDDGN
ncbi:MAG TPA: AsmA-like C-terminal region-containing protein, partial [Flavipsychrobacter sp.]|nr:AsmA-like C-terminal region-containing protein [Flavipsychrobacter sp.]